MKFSKYTFIHAFTLAEIMIVLTVIGVLTAILLPAAFHATPDENIMKFKKANSTLGTAIRELVNSDEYYAEGDLGKFPDGRLIDWDNAENYTYFCETLAEVLNTKNINCSDAEIKTGGSVQTYLENAKIKIDRYCKEYAPIVGEEIITSDGVVYFQTGPNRTFGSMVSKSGTGATSTTRNFGKDGYYKDENGFDVCYKIFCIDVDGIPKNATSDDCINECPFGYGIRVDGKILPGPRAMEWIEKSIQNNE